MKKFLKIITVLIAILFTLAFVSCNKSTGDNNKTTGGNNKEQITIIGLTEEQADELQQEVEEAESIDDLKAIVKKIPDIESFTDDIFKNADDKEPTEKDIENSKKVLSTFIEVLSDAEMVSKINEVNATKSKKELKKVCKGITSAESYHILAEFIDQSESLEDAQRFIVSLLLLQKMGNVQGQEE